MTHERLSSLARVPIAVATKDSFSYWTECLAHRLTSDQSHARLSAMREHEVNALGLPVLEEDSLEAYNPACCVYKIAEGIPTRHESLDLFDKKTIDIWEALFPDIPLALEQKQQVLPLQAISFYVYPWSIGCQQALSYELSFASEDLKNTTRDQDARPQLFAHEFVHGTMQPFLESEDLFRSSPNAPLLATAHSFFRELQADHLSLSKAQLDITRRRYISFINSPPNYWIAPALEALSLEVRPPNFQKIYAAGLEIREKLYKVVFKDVFLPLDQRTAPEENWDVFWNWTADQWSRHGGIVPHTGHPRIFGLLKNLLTAGQFKDNSFSSQIAHKIIQASECFLSEEALEDADTFCKKLPAPKRRQIEGRSQIWPSSKMT